MRTQEKERTMAVPNRNEGRFKTPPAPWGPPCSRPHGRGLHLIIKLLYNIINRSINKLRRHGKRPDDRCRRGVDIAKLREFLMQGGLKGLEIIPLSTETRDFVIIQTTRALKGVYVRVS